jgi:hypothetical protein
MDQNDDEPSLLTKLFLSLVLVFSIVVIGFSVVYQSINYADKSKRISIGFFVPSYPMSPQKKHHSKRRSVANMMCIISSRRSRFEEDLDPDNMIPPEE